MILYRLYKLGYFDEARKWIEKAIENGAENNPVILEHMGDVLWKLGQEQDAIDYWNRAAEAGEGSELLHEKIKQKQLLEQ